jgi:hypothetical protein
MGKPQLHRSMRERGYIDGPFPINITQGSLATGGYWGEYTVRSLAAETACIDPGDGSMERLYGDRL